MARIAIVGAGVSGLRCGSELRARGHDVVVFEKSRGLGGRASTRRSEQGAFDHGAQYFTARDPRFASEVRGWIAAGDAAEWRGRIVSLRSGDALPVNSGGPRFVTVPGMSSLGKLLAGGLSVRTESEVAHLERTSSRWVLHLDRTGPVGPFEAVVLAIPAPQAQQLLGDVSAIATRVRDAGMEPCIALMAHYPVSPNLSFDGAFVEDSPLSWIARNGSKPARGPDANWVLHGSSSWSAAHFERDASWQTEAMFDAFDEAVGRKLSRSAVTAIRCWRYARPTNPLPDECLLDAEMLLGACGDWCGAPRVEGAYLSGLALAESISRVLAGRS